MTDSSDTTLPLAAGFPVADEAMWRTLAAKALKGGSLARLSTATYDGFSIAPLAPRRGDARPLRGAGAWQVMQRIDHPAPDTALSDALDELHNGTPGLMLVSSGAPGCHGFGIDPDHETLGRILEKLDPRAGVTLDLDLGDVSDDSIAMLRMIVQPHADATIRFGFDPLGAMAQHGGAPARWSERAPRWAAMIGHFADAGFHGPFAVADGRIVHNAGGTPAQELAYTIGCALAYLRALDAAGVARAQARDWIFFRLAADADFFPTIAKFRALRRLWARVQEACDLVPAPACITAQTAWRMQTVRDANTNLIRNTIAAAAAGLGGADAIAVLPHSVARGLPDRFARRVARNTQWLLLEESHLAKVGDPAAGSGGIEALTEQLCATAWTLFQEMEAQGDLAAVLENGIFQARVVQARGQREKAVATRHDSLIGTTDHALLDEPAIETRPDAPQTTPARAFPLRVTPLVPFRLAEPFEALRDAADGFFATQGERPHIFLACLGAQSEFAARAGFARNFFAAGGIAARVGEGRHSMIVEDFRRAGTPLACICGSDAAYAQDAQALAAALKVAGARWLSLAGRPGEGMATPQIDAHIFQGCDALERLRAAHGILRETERLP